MRNKAQTAMEYLMTYGWAILIIIVVIAALYSLGVFSVKPTVACSPCFSYFAFRDYDTAGDQLYLRNGARTISVTGVTNGNAQPVASDGVTAICPDAGGNACSAGTDLIITGVDATQAGAATSVQVTISYTDADTGAPHTDTATIHER